MKPLSNPFIIPNSSLILPLSLLNRGLYSDGTRLETEMEIESRPTETGLDPQNYRITNFLNLGRPNTSVSDRVFYLFLYLYLPSLSCPDKT